MKNKMQLKKILKQYVMLYDILKKINAAIILMKANVYFFITDIEKLNYNNCKQSSIKATHISAFTFGNAGDTLLPLVLRDLFKTTIGIKRWHHIHVHREIDDYLLGKINQKDVLFIGGGGLFLKDTNPNNLSGWQWSCSIDQLKKISVPIIMFAVGYNRFRGQEDFEPLFIDHFNSFTEKAAFIGIRNTGSINKLKEYLRKDTLKEKLQFQPCMTAIISKIYGHKINFHCKEDFIAVNCAFDRQNLRFRSDELLYALARVIKKLSEITRIKYYSHASSDNHILPYFDELDLRYEVIKLHDAKQIIYEYKRPRLVIGMRGHAQMIPFGCLTPILSIITHDKLNWFLEDVSHPEWGIDVLQSDFEERLLEKTKQTYQNYEQCIKEIENKQNKLWDITLRNINSIHTILSSS
jgi:polysaccharide pyruvyl transferase WcaK-like protein